MTQADTMLVSPPATPWFRHGSWRERSWLGLAAMLLLVSTCASEDAARIQALHERPAQAEGSRYGYYLAGRHAERESDFASAARFMNDALRGDDANPELLYRTFTLLVADGRHAEAADLARRVAEAQPQQLIPALVLAFEEVRSGDFAAAERRLSGLPLTNINRVVVPLTNAWLIAGQGKTAAAVEALRPLANVGGFTVLHDLHAGYISDLGGRVAEAGQSYKAVIDAQERLSPRIVEAVGGFLERTGQAEEARALYERYQKQSPDSLLTQRALTRIRQGTKPAPMIASATAGLGEAMHNLSTVLRQENSGQNALIFGRLALAVVPDMPPALLLVGDILESQGQRPAANALYERIPASSSLRFASLLRVAQNLHAMDKTDEAIGRLETMARDFRDQPDALITLGNILRGKERFVEAAAAYDRAVERIAAVEQGHWSLFYARGIALERSKQWSRAEADFQKALELQPEQPDVLNYLAYSWVEQGLHFERARAMLERAVALRPNNGYIIDSLGWVLYRKGLYQEAVPHLERAVERQPEDRVILDHLGDAYWRVGRLNEARFQWRRALQHKPDAELKPKIEDKLLRGLEGPGAAAPAQRGG